MAVRDDIRVLWHLSPRIALVAVPSTGLTIQDEHDTLRDIEDEPSNIIYDETIVTEGGQALGTGGVKVGLTAIQQNLLVAFESDKTNVASGTITTADVDGLFLTDSTATFISAGVKVGAWVLNLRTGAIATVFGLLSEIQLELDGLGDGSPDDEWQVGDSYKIWNVRQCEVSGGNATAIDGIGTGSSISPILPTALTQVILAQASTATLQELKAIQVSSYNQGEGNGVLVDVFNKTGLASSGTDHPTGTAEKPVDNFVDALAINASRGFRVLYLLDKLSEPNGIVLPGLDFTDIRFIGESQFATRLILDPSASVAGCEFSKLTLSGTGDGLVLAEECFIVNLTGVEGLIHRCGWQGKITASGNPGSKLTIWDCFDDVPGTGTPELDCNGLGTKVICRGFDGGLVISNKSGPEDISVTGPTRVVLASDFGGTGQLVLRGVAEPVENNSSPLFTNIKSDGVVSGEHTKFAYQALRGRLVVNIDTQKLELYDPDTGALVDRWPIKTKDGELVVTAKGAQVEREGPE